MKDVRNLKQLNTIQASVVQKVDSAIQRINHYPADKHSQDRLSYPVDSDLSIG